MEKELYGEMAALEKTHWWFVGRRNIIVDVAKRFARKDARMLDVGVGTGMNAKTFIEEGFAVDGLEPSDEAIRFANVVAPQLSIIQDRFPSERIVSGSYDVVTLFDVLEHFDNDQDALVGVTRALAPGGIALFTVPAFSFLWTGHDELAHHKRRYRKSELVIKLREAGLEPQFVSYYNFFLFPAIALVRLLQKMLRVQKKGSDFAATPAFLNAPFAYIFGAERFLLRLTPLPWGVSIIAVARKPR